MTKTQNIKELKQKPIAGLDQIVILCGGKGVRLKPWTDSTPKPLATLNGKPICDYILDFYRSKGFAKFILCVGYMGDKIREHYQKAAPGLEITFSDIGEKASMLQRLQALKDLVHENFCVCYGDTLIKLDIQSLVDHHTQNKAMATIVVAKIRSPFGLVGFDQKGLVQTFEEKPTMNYYIGSFIMKRSVLTGLSPELLAMPDGQGLVKLFQDLAAKKQLYVYEYEGPQITFNTEKERQEAEKDVNSFYTLNEESKGQ